MEVNETQSLNKWEIFTTLFVFMFPSKRKSYFILFIHKINILMNIIQFFNL